jgi:hypothetical protein
MPSEVLYIMYNNNVFIAKLISVVFLYFNQAMMKLTRHEKDGFFRIAYYITIYVTEFI